MRDASAETKPLVRAGDLRSPALAPLGLKLVAGEGGLERPIDWPRVQKPGLAVAGFLPYVKANRVQILGESEFDYLKTLPPRVVRQRLDAFTALPMSCVVVTKGLQPFPALRRFCKERSVPLFVTPRLTSVSRSGAERSSSRSSHEAWKMANEPSSCRLVAAASMYQRSSPDESVSSEVDPELPDVDVEAREDRPLFRARLELRQAD